MKTTVSTPTDYPIIEKFPFSEGKYPWTNENEIEALKQGRKPKSVDEAIALVQQRFGVAYQYLPEVFQRNPRVAYVAAMQSSGNALLSPRIAPAVKMSFPPEFYAKILRDGVSSWFMKNIQRMEIHNDPDVEAAYQDRVTAEDSNRLEKVEV